MDTTPDPQKDRQIGLSYSFAGSFHDELQKLANARFDGNRSATAEHFINVGVLADSEQILPPALVEQVSELAGRQGLPFLKALENVLAAGLPVAREEAAGVSTARQPA